MQSQKNETSQNLVQSKKRVMILSGAGLSAESGIKTFRDSGGLWEEYNIDEVCTAEGFKKDPNKVREFYNKRRIQLKDVEPNAAHYKIAELKARYKDNISVITQNVDDLLERAGCEGVLHLHGFLPELYCRVCRAVFNIGYSAQTSTICPNCGRQKTLRHNIVMFNEEAPNYAIFYKELRHTDMLVCIGTSGAVLPISSFAKMCKYSILNNLEITEGVDSHFSKVYYYPATQAIENIARDIEAFLQSTTKSIES